MKYGEDNDLETYYTIFKNVSNNLKIRKLILKIKYTELFFKELSMRAKEKAMRKTSMNFEKLKTMKFNTVCAFMIKEAQKVKKQNMIKELMNKKTMRKLI